VRALVEAENWDQLERLVDDVDPYFFEGLQPIYLHDLDRLERRILIEILLPVGADRRIDRAAFAQCAISLN
jgi:hypothetical protein